MSENDVVEPGFGTYLKAHWQGHALLLIAFILALVVGSLAVFPDVVRQLAYGVASSSFALFLFQVITDYKNIAFTANLLNRLQFSFHVGAKLHESHDHLMSRRDAVTEFLRSHDTLRLLTTTADDYIYEQRDAYQAVRRKLKDGARLDLLLYTPIFHLTDFLDWQLSKDLEEAPGADLNARVGHGQHHTHASALINEQIEKTIPAIEALQREFNGQVEVRFFSVRHHVNMAIYGSKRIFAAPLMLSIKGRDLPCLEVFPGMVDTRLFEKMAGEFEYLWSDLTVTFSLRMMKEVYKHLKVHHSEYLLNHWMKIEAAGDVEQFAHGKTRKSEIRPAALPERVAPPDQGP
jgi:hypothetical protein